jgi:hypothetical protein
MPLDPRQDNDADLVRAGADLDRAREKFLLSMVAVEREVTRALDWRQWVRRAPGIAVGLAFAAGVFLGWKD